MPLIRFRPQGVDIEAEIGTSILKSAQKAGVGIRAECGGRGACGSCKVAVDPANSFSSPAAREREILGDGLAKGLRLACLTEVLADGTATVPPDSRPEQVIALEENYGSQEPVVLKPAVRQLFLQIPAATLAEPTADGQLLLQALRRYTGRQSVAIELATLQQLPNIVRTDKGRVTAAIWQGQKLLDLKPGYQELLLGVAVDLGTTTMVAYLFDLRNGQLLGRASGLNPQTAYGADVLTRIHYASETTANGQRLQQIVADGVNKLISQACARAQVKPEDVLEVVMVGNTAMHHLCLGLEARYLALAPYAPAWAESLDVPARQIGLTVHPAANLHLLPNKAGFVGADSMAVLLALEPYRQDDLQLIIDFGTNGEMFLADRQHLWSCSTAAGPAFEGAQIRCGVRAQEGAIDHIELVPGSQEIQWRSIGNHPPLGICGTGLIAAVAALRKAGILEANGRFNPRSKTRRLRPGQEGSEYVVAWAEETATGEAVVITQRDVRQVQLGKAAVAAGCRLLLNQAQVKIPDAVVLAGGFGSYIQPEAAQTIGLIPVLSPEKIKVVGNAAGHGACLALLNADKRKEVDILARRVQYIELSAEPSFADEFIRSTMLIPWAE